MIDIKKKKQRLWNPGTLELLKKKGSNLNMIHKMVNVFHIFEEERIPILKKTLIEQGFNIYDITKIAENDQIIYWALHAQIEFVPTKNEIDKMTDECVDLAFSLGVEYDGWYTQPVD
jgi:hypothetical protein